ncbi:hypothetical protein Csp2054_09285 [Curtobacterium sp. 'Ferrero']|uniref:hypothetical protein n=1 Tax=Curtobacterium sp. 'Ferrero' TaxID=2033654 RepID=UPI000BD8B364|nr:hypothetical protein [Curtobacterium sp. 'Ferrero']PCN48056.1 hypothetical protein Csp2054_09285 [Curtobacterium sp. 'Ferrero']
MNRLRPRTWSSSPHLVVVPDDRALTAAQHDGLRICAGRGRVGLEADCAGAAGGAGTDAHFRDVDTDEWFWLSGPKRDRTDARYGHGAPTVDDDARSDYEAFLDGAPLPGREHG